MAEGGYRLHIELGKLPVDRLCGLLRSIDRCGSINRAASELGLSYRYAWGLLKQAEERLSEPLLRKRVGGPSGGGAELTEPARELLERYARVQAELGGRLDRWFGGEPAGSAAPAPDAGSATVAGTRLEAGAGARPLLLASTIGPIETGLVDALAEAFLQETGIMIRHIAAGSGQALAIARDGRADLALTHAPGLEEQFMAAGWGGERRPLMSNDFLLLGPAADPAGAGQADSLLEALRRIAAGGHGAHFLSRGDWSGTHLKELELWQAAGVQPGPPWHRVYKRGALGSLATLRGAAAAGAYTLADRAAWLTARAMGLELAVLHAGDPLLRNPFSLITLNPDRFPQVQGGPAARFVRWATGPAGQGIIGAFGRDQFGEPLFRPALTR